MDVAPKPSARERNPGPSWGYRFMSIADRVLPEWIFGPFRMLGTWIGVVAMPGPRACSREYLRLALGREPSLRDVFRQFLGMEESLMTRLRVANGASHPCVISPLAVDFSAWLAAGGPMILGAFHVGNSELTGFLLAAHARRRLHILRRRIGNSYDTEALSGRFAGAVGYIWVNRPDDLLFALKDAMGGVDPVALHCDRPDFSSRSDSFEFFGVARRFPTTIYHLGMIFGRPVILSFGMPSGPDTSVVHASPRWEPRAKEGRKEAVARAHTHFQDFLRVLEAELRRDPYQWLNFTPFNPRAPDSPGNPGASR